MKKHVSLTTSIFIMMILGMAAGYVASDLMVQLKFVGDIFLRLIQMSIVLLVMGSVVEAIASLDLHSLGRLGTKAFAGFSVTTVAAATVGLVLANVLTPGSGISFGQELTTNVKGSDATLASIITNFFPKNIVQSIADGNTIQVIVFALFLGVSINIVMERTHSKELLHGVKACNECLLTIVRLVMKMAPIGIFSLLGWAIGKYGFAVILPLFKFLGGMALGSILILATGITTAAFVARVSPLALAGKLVNMGVVAFTTTSSAVTLPVKMADSENKIGISRRVSRLINPLGMTLNSDGLALYLALACITVAQCFLSSRFPHFRRRNSPSSSWENPHFQRALSGRMFHYCILPHEGVFHPVAPAASHQEVAVVGQTVNHGGCHLFIGKDAAPFRELQVRRQDEALALVAV